MSTEIRLRKCQERAKDTIVNDVLAHLEDYSVDTKNRRFGFMAPTGSGKTLVMAKSIKEVSKQRNRKVAFVWLTLGKGELADQSRKKLETYLNQSGLKVVSIQEAILETDLSGTVTVVSWESLNKTDKDGNVISIAMRDGDKDSFPKVCEQTIQNSIPIVLLIDESHHGAFTDKSLEIRNKIQPAYTLEVSATPKDAGWDAYTKIKYEDAAQSGLIKKNIRQATFLAWQDGIRLGAKKLQELIQLAKDTKVEYNPRMLVFLPNANQNGGDELDQATALLNDEFGWSEATGDVVVWMSKYKSENYEVCKDNGSATKVIFTKEAIDTGIDIPAVQIIVHLRPQGSTQVEVQKIGRGLRMPELKHYDNALDTLYFFVFNDHDFDFSGADLLKDVLNKKSSSIKPEFAKLAAAFPAIKMSYYERKSSLLEADEVDFAATFTSIFDDKLSVHNGFVWSASYTEETREGELNLDTKVSTFDKSVQSTLNEDSIDSFYNDRMRMMLKHASKHLGIIEDSIGCYMQSKEPDADYARQQIFTLNNFSELDRLIFESIEEGESGLDIIKTQRDLPFHIPNDYYVNGDPDTQYQKFLHDKYFITRGGRSIIEVAFEKELEKSSKVLWWMKNYDRQYAQSFSTCYGGDKVFFPDYIIAFTDGTFLIVDTKCGNIDINEKDKRESLIAVTAAHSNIMAGIIKQERDHFYLHTAGSVPVAMSTVL